MSPPTVVAPARPEIVTEEPRGAARRGSSAPTTTDHKSVGLLYLGAALFFAALAVGRVRADAQCS